MRYVVLGVASVAAACAAKRAPLPPDFSDLPEEPAAPPSPPETTATGTGTGRFGVAGHAAARFRFPIPQGLGPLAGVTPPSDPHQLIDFSSQRPAGVGIPDGQGVAVNSIVVFSDPEGVGPDVTTLSVSQLAEIRSAYLAFLRERIPSAGDLELVRVGGRLAFRVELPHVEMPDRPVRSGRHYLVFDQVATASVDCLWIAAEAPRMTQACDTIAAGLVREPTP